MRSEHSSAPHSSAPHSSAPHSSAPHSSAPHSSAPQCVLFGPFPTSTLCLQPQIASTNTPLQTSTSSVHSTPSWPSGECFTRGVLPSANIIGNHLESESRISINSAVSGPSLVFVVLAPENFLRHSTPNQLAEVPYNLKSRIQKHAPPTIFRCGCGSLVNFRLIHRGWQEIFAQKPSPSLEDRAASRGLPPDSTTQSSLLDISPRKTVPNKGVAALALGGPGFPGLIPIPLNEATLRVAGHHPRRDVPPVPGSSGYKPDSK